MPTIRLKRTSTLTVYRDIARQWRWRLQTANGRIVADGAQGYRTERHAQRAALSAMQAMAGASLRSA